jgi:CheY-like chemotaxis protein
MSEEPSPKPSRRLSILIVDDSAMMRVMIRRALTLAAPDVDVTEAESGPAALEVLGARAIDAVLTDINMPGMNGSQLLREIDKRGWHHVRRVVISTDGSDARREEIGDLGVMAYIQKPFPPEAVRDLLSQLQESHHGAH